MHRKTHYTETPIKPLRVYEEMNKVFPRDTVYVTTIGLSQIAGAQFLHVYGPRQWINCGQAGPLGWTIPAALGVVASDPTRTVVGLSGDYDFQFLIEELAVGAQFRLPYVQVLVNNSYLGLIRQSQRGFEMDYCVQLAFDNQNVTEPALQSYGVDHMKVVQGLGCKSLRVTDPEKIEAAMHEAQAKWRSTYRVPVVVEVHPREGDQHRDGHRDRQDQRVRGHRLPPPRRPPGPGDGRSAGVKENLPCHVLPPTSRCCSPRCLCSNVSSARRAPASPRWRCSSPTRRRPPRSATGCRRTA
jgi:thiamine pyrophosphate-dependent acetolactate synthase large subunit-like protein